MASVIFVRADGVRQEAAAAAGLSVMQIATRNLVPGIIGECGGEMTCATCHVFVDPLWRDAVPQMSAEEEDMLDVTAEEPTEDSRLSCQLRFDEALDGLVVHVPGSQR